jgi:predicted transcriptional regulator
MRNAFSYAQWKIAIARMQEANMAASEITEQGGLTQPAARKIAEYHLDRYFEMVEGQLNYRRSCPERRTA